MNVAEIHKRLQRAMPQMFNQRNFTRDNIHETVKYYDKLGVTYVDDEENVSIL